MFQLNFSYGFERLMRMNFDEGYVIFQYERLSIQHANIKHLTHESENLIKRCFD